MLRMTIGTNQRLSRLNTLGKQNGFRPQMFEVKNTFECTRHIFNTKLYRKITGYLLASKTQIELKVKTKQLPSTVNF